MCSIYCREAKSPVVTCQCRCQGQFHGSVTYEVMRAGEEFPLWWKEELRDNVLPFEKVIGGVA